MVPTDEGKSQRVRFGVMCACHAVAFALAMAIIGFPEMISEFFIKSTLLFMLLMFERVASNYLLDFISD